MLISAELLVSLTSPNFIALHFLVSEILREGAYCCITRTTLFTTMFTNVYSLKSACASFILIGFCVSELHAHLCPHSKVWPEAVLQELQCLLCCLHVSIMRVMSIYHFTKFRSSSF